MADDLKKVASDLVDDVLNGVSNEFSKSPVIKGKSCDRSLLCIILSPSMYIFILNYYLLQRFKF